MSEQPITERETNKTVRAAIWVAIGSLIAAAIVCVVWVLLGDADGMVGKAFLTILLLASFAGISILEANLAPNRPAWVSLVSMITWVIALLVGAFFIWMPDESVWGSAGTERFMKFLLIVLILQLALLHIRLFVKSYQRYQTTFTSIATYVTVGFVAILVGMLILSIVAEEYMTFRPLFWRVTVALAILAAVGTAIVPLVNALFAPKKPRAVAYAPAGAAGWPTYSDGATPLPVLPDGSPDWNAFYTGYPTYPQMYAAPVASADENTTGDESALAEPTVPAVPLAPPTGAPIVPPGDQR